MLRPARHGIVIACATTSLASAVSAAGIERAGPSSRVLFETGRYVEFSGTYANPDLSGEGGEFPPGTPIPGTTGNILDSFTNFGAAYKADINDRMSYAIILDQPYGVSLSYPRGLYDGTSATIDTTTLTGVLAYDITPAVKAWAGVRAQRMSADGAIPFLGDYTIETDTDIGYGYMLGVAYQKPEIALRVALSYYSAIEQEFETVEFGAIDGTLEVETPQQVVLEFQSGIAVDTLVFGSIRWVDWPQFEIDPQNYPLDIPLVSYEKPWTAYSLGIGRQFTDRIAGAFEVRYEPQTDTVQPALGPVDGGTFLTASMSYDMEPFTISGGVTYGWLGSAENELGSSFDDGTIQGIGFRISYNF